MTDEGAELEAWYYLAVCGQIVTFMAPFGALLSSHFHRQVLAAFIYVLDTVALVSALQSTKHKNYTVVSCQIYATFVFTPLLGYA